MIQPSARSSQLWNASAIAVLLVALPFAGSGVVVLEAAAAQAATEGNRASIQALADTDGDARPRFAKEPVRAATAGPQAEVSTRTSHEAPKSERMFGVLPNYTMVEAGTNPSRVSAHQTFRMAALSSLDPHVVPFVGVVAAINHGSSQSYTRRYATSLADSSIGNFLTTAVMPLAMGQDPRYFESGHGGIVQRVGYAASRSVMTRGRSGHPQFNVSEIGGNAIAAGLSNLYYTPGERTVTGTLTRWAMQVMWDTLSNEMKEFWPDIRHKLHHE